MLRLAKIVVLWATALTAFAHRPALAACEIVKATHSADTKGEALQMARALAARSAAVMKKKKGWRSMRMSAYKVQPDPFWKKVRPQVPKYAIYGSYVTAKTHTTCFTGVVVPYVCTSGSKVCGN